MWPRPGRTLTAQLRMCRRTSSIWTLHFDEFSSPSEYREILHFPFLDYSFHLVLSFWTFGSFLLRKVFQPLAPPSLRRLHPSTSYTCSSCVECYGPGPTLPSPRAVAPAPSRTCSSCVPRLPRLPRLGRCPTSPRERARRLGSARISHVFGLRGPINCSDTACSSSLVASHGGRCGSEVL